MSTHLKAGVCGHFGGGGSFSDGQTVKTVVMTEQLKNMGRRAGSFSGYLSMEETYISDFVSVFQYD